MSKLLKISGCDNNTRLADVIFLHGLGGDALKTWRFGDSESTSWPHWIGAEFPDLGVWSGGYAASPTKWTRFFGWFWRKHRDIGHSMSLPGRALQVLDLMTQRDLGKRPILFICHSLGGLLAKQILRAASDSVEPLQKVIFSQTRGVLFLATPHAGATLASIVNAFRIILGATVSIEDMRAHDAHLRNLFDWYRHHSENIRTVTYFETRNVFGAKIVDQTSSHPGVGADPIGLDEDHLSIAKPREKDAQVCGAARDLLLRHICPALLKNPSASSTKGGDREIRATEVIIQLSESTIDRYARSFTHKHGTVRVLGMSHPIPVVDIFTSVRLSDPSYLFQHEDPRELDNQFRKNDRRFSVPTDMSIGSLEASEKFQFLQIVGGPGSGKSTCLKRIAVVALSRLIRVHATSNRAGNVALPVFLELGRLRVDTADERKEVVLAIESAVTEELVECGLSKSEAEELMTGAHTKHSQKGPFVFLFDGFDEIPDAIAGNLKDGLEGIVEKYRTCRFVVTCRIGVRQTAFTNFTDAVIKEFSDEEIQEFVARWSQSITTGHRSFAPTFCAELFEAKNEAVRELARTPLFLTLLCIVAGCKAQLPRNKTELYKRALEILLVEWNKAKPYLKGLTARIKPKHELTFLGKLAFETFQANTYVFDKNELEDFLRDNWALLKFWIRRAEVAQIRAVIDIVEAEQGIWIRRSGNTYSFSHLSIQEYLSAQHLHDFKKADEILEKNLFDERWREVFVNLCSLPGGEVFTEKILRRVHGLSEQIAGIAQISEWIPKFVKGERLSSRLLAFSLVLCAMSAFRTNRIERAQRIKSSVGASYMRKSMRLQIERAGGNIDRLLGDSGIGDDAASPEEVFDTAKRAMQMAYLVDSSVTHTSPFVVRQAREIAAIGANAMEVASKVIGQIVLRPEEFNLRGSLSGAFSKGTWDTEEVLDPLKIETITGFKIIENYVRRGEAQAIISYFYGSALAELCAQGSGRRRDSSSSKV